MSLDISLMVDNDTKVITPEYFENKHLYSLSREFCNLLCRPGVVNHTPELDQIGQLTELDLSHLYTMTEYPSEEEEFDLLEYAESEEVMRNLQSDLDKRKLAVSENIHKVKSLINQLVDRLQAIDNLYDRLIKTNFDTMNSSYYFSDFNEDKGTSYLEHNLGQDLRNFKRFIDYAIDRNAKTIWFELG